MRRESFGFQGERGGANTPYKDRVVLDLSQEPDWVVKEWTGFASGQDLLTEFLACGGPAAVRALDRAVVVHDEDALRRAAEHLRSTRMFPEATLDEAVRGRRAHLNFVARGSESTRVSKVPLVNIWALPFVVMRTGATLALVASSQYYLMQKAQVSLLLSNMTRSLAPVWQRRWCPPRSLQWVRDYCSDDGTIVIFVDGTDVEFEQPLNHYVQRVLYGVKNKHLSHAAGRLLTFTNSRGWLVHLSDMATPFVSEVSMLRLDSFLQRLDDEAQSPAWIEMVVDRGYYFWHPRKDYKWLLVKKVTPVHLVAPEPKDVKRARRARKEKRAKAVFFKAAIAKHNKRVQRMRQSNERVNRKLKTPRMYQRKISLKLLPKMRRFNVFAHGLANKTAGCPPAQ
jgi:hypothetical protein